MKFGQLALNVLNTRLIALESKPIDFFALIVTISKLLLWLHEIATVDNCPRLSMTR